MVEVEFLKDWKCCWKKGQRAKIREHFALALLDYGNIIKVLSGPPMDKMIHDPVMAKELERLKVA